ncbi:hypothetical protein [Dysgonomonas sp. PF1-23]|nr:hypothetical protein [Dysgonomonas sp. PF1-23]MDH6398414.1 hypothetical protein [Dysgonomonas sp. PF1-23]
MALFEKGNTVGNRFTSENQPKKNGRKPSLYKQLKSITGKKVDYELSKEDYFKTIRFLMERTKDELNSIMKDEQTPIWVCNIISAIFSDIRYGRTSTVEMIFDRLFGKSTQPIEGDVNANVSGSVGMVDLSKLTTEELVQYNQLLDKINGKKV